MRARVLQKTSCGKWQACGLPLRGDKEQSGPADEILALVVPAQANQQDEDVVDPVDKAHAAVIAFGLLPANDKFKFSKAWWHRFSQAKLGVPKGMWEKLLAKDLMIAAEKKAEPDFFIPRISCKKRLEDLCSSKQPEAVTVLQESIDASLFWEKLESNPSRQADIVSSKRRNLLSNHKGIAW